MTVYNKAAEQDGYRVRWNHSQARMAAFNLGAAQRKIERSIGAEMVRSGCSQTVPEGIGSMVKAAQLIATAQELLIDADSKL